MFWAETVLQRNHGNRLRPESVIKQRIRDPNATNATQGEWRLDVAAGSLASQLMKNSGLIRRFDFELPGWLLPLGPLRGGCSVRVPCVLPANWHLLSRLVITGAIYLAINAPFGDLILFNPLASR